MGQKTRSFFRVTIFTKATWPLVLVGKEKKASRHAIWSAVYTLFNYRYMDLTPWATNINLHNKGGLISEGILTLIPSTWDQSSQLLKLSGWGLFSDRDLFCLKSISKFGHITCWRWCCSSAEHLSQQIIWKTWEVFFWQCLTSDSNWEGF